jgi:hypothetical protein
LSRDFARAKQRYAASAAQARQTAAANLKPIIGIEFHLSDWNRRAQEAYHDQWHTREPTADRFDWEQIFRRYRQPDQLEIAIWAFETRLCGLGLATTTSRAIKVEFIEGDPRADCPLKGRRALIMLEAAVCYGQARGRTEIRVQPINDRLRALYVDKFKFSPVTPKGQQPYFHRPI